jgi:predicted  nucleic acid-binding Zn-ribbon protein
VAIHRDQTEELERSNSWAAALNREVDERRARVTALQSELAEHQESAQRMANGYEAKIADLVEWARNLKAEFEQERASTANVLLRLDEEKRHLELQLAMVRASRWVRLGREFGLGPR